MNEDKYMTNYEQYEAVLKNRAILYVVFVIITLIGIGLLIYFFNSKKEFFWKNMKKIEIVCINVFAAIVVSLVSIYTIKYVCDTFYDISNQAYVIYEGEFVIDSSIEGYITIFDGEKKTVLVNNKTELPSGTHNGTIIYAKKTEIILEVHTENN